MTKSLRSYPPGQREAIARRRVHDVVERGAQAGWGYWAAVDFLSKLAKGLIRS